MIPSWINVVSERNKLQKKIYTYVDCEQNVFRTICQSCVLVKKEMVSNELKSSKIESCTIRNTYKWSVKYVWLCFTVNSLWVIVTDLDESNFAWVPTMSESTQYRCNYVEYYTDLTSLWWICFCQGLIKLTTIEWPDFNMPLKSKWVFKSFLSTVHFVLCTPTLYYIWKKFPRNLFWWFSRFNFIVNHFWENARLNKCSLGPHISHSQRQVLLTLVAG